MRNADEKSQTAEEGITVSNRFFLFLILGFVLVFVGITVVLVTAVLYGGGSANFGGVIFIGPFPIVIGAGPDTTLMVLFGIILAVLSVIMFLVMRRRIKGSGG
jgi:uncharacterized membrane protein